MHTGGSEGTEFQAPLGIARLRGRFQVGIERVMRSGVLARPEQRIAHPALNLYLKLQQPCDYYMREVALHTNVRKR